MVIEYNEGNLKELINKGEIIVIDFYAEWCAPCRLMLPIIDKLGETLDERVMVVKVNVDKNPELAKELKVSGIPTIMFFKNGEFKEKTIGLKDINSIQTIISGLLK